MEATHTYHVHVTVLTELIQWSTSRNENYKFAHVECVNVREPALSIRNRLYINYVNNR